MTDANTTDAVSEKVLRDFALVLGAGFVLIFGLLLPWIWGWSFPLWPWVFAAMLALPAFTAPRILSPLYKGWMKVGHVLGWINTRIILGLTFYIVIMPAGFIMRVFRKDPMARKLRTNEASYRVPTKESTPDQLKRPF